MTSYDFDSDLVVWAQLRFQHPMFKKQLWANG